MRLIALIVLSFSIPAIACPNLAGKYLTCRSTTGDTDLSNIEITQTLTNGITTYTLTDDENSDVVKANGKTSLTTVSDPDSGTTIKTYITGSCTSTTFSMRVALYMDNELVANVTTRFTKTGNELHQQLSGSAMGDPVNDKIICE